MKKQPTKKQLKDAVTYYEAELNKLSSVCFKLRENEDETANTIICEIDNILKNCPSTIPACYL